MEARVSTQTTVLTISRVLVRIPGGLAGIKGTNLLGLRTAGVSSGTDCRGQAPQGRDGHQNDGEYHHSVIVLDNFADEQERAALGRRSGGGPVRECDTP